MRSVGTGERSEREWLEREVLAEFRSRVTRALCARVGNHDQCELGVTLGEVAAEVLAEWLAQGEVTLTVPPASGPDYESPRLVCWAHGPHGELCSRYRGHRGEHVDIAGVVGGVWVSPGGETRELDDVRAAVRDPHCVWNADGSDG